MLDADIIVDLVAVADISNMSNVEGDGQWPSYALPELEHFILDGHAARQRPILDDPVGTEKATVVVGQVHRRRGHRLQQCVFETSCLRYYQLGELELFLLAECAVLVARWQREHSL
jgi:hypothetical protein